MDKTMLIIGEGSSTYGINQIIKQDSKKLVDGLYGSGSPLVEAFNLSVDLGVKNIYVANCKTKTAVIDLMHIAKQHDFTYIVPINVHFSDKVFNSQLQRQMTYSEVFLRIISTMSNSILIMTDNHASLYEDIDSFLDDMKSKISSFKAEAQMALENGRQLIFSANNIHTINYSNVILASMLCITNLPNYPKANIPAAIFDIDAEDIDSNELAYFKSNTYAYNSVENLVNFHNENNAYKIALIDMVIRELNSELDITGFNGKLFNSQVKLKIRSFLKDYLDSKKGVLIRDYAIIDIQAVLNNDYSYTLTAHFKILPMNSLEECDVVIEV